jgi:hypothetical protein
MMLRPSSANEPFRPLFVIDGQRSILPEDFHEDELKFFAEIISDIHDNLLRARLADIVWLKSSVRDYKVALIAIDAYISVPLDWESWIREGEHCLQRAITLTKLLKTGAGNRLNEIENTVIAAIRSGTDSEGFLTLQLAECLASKDLGSAHLSEIASKLQNLASSFDDAEEHLKARAYYKSASDWYQRAKAFDKSADTLVSRAESFAKEAQVKRAGQAPANILATSLFEEAIQAYRLIPKALRNARNVDRHIDELRGQLKVSGEHAIEEFTPISTPSVDVREIVDGARMAVEGKSLQDALRGFASLDRGANASKLRQQVVENLNTFVMSRLFGSTLFSHDGRVVAKRPAYGLGDAAADERVVLAEMIRDHSMSIDLTVRTCIMPALYVLRCEHQFRERDFIDLARSSPIVPPRREALVAKALFAGFDLDFPVALHLLVPQVENVVRHHQRGGVSTTMLDVDGVEMEIGLSALMALPEVNRIFGENLAFELRAIFCDAFGPNLRNEVAHGLVDDVQCDSTHSIYAWWFVFRWVFNSNWFVRNQKTAETPTPL